MLKKRRMANFRKIKYFKSKPIRTLSNNKNRRRPKKDH